MRGSACLAGPVPTAAPLAFKLSPRPAPTTPSSRSLGAWSWPRHGRIDGRRWPPLADERAQIHECDRPGRALDMGSARRRVMTPEITRVRSEMDATNRRLDRDV